MRLRLLPFLACFLAPTTAACHRGAEPDKSVGDDDDDDLVTTTTPQGPASLEVRVVGLDGSPVPGATVRLGGVDVETDGAGLARGEVAAGRVVAPVQATGFVPTAAVLDLEPGIAAEARVVVMRQGPPVAFDAGAGITSAVGGVLVTVPPDGFVDAAGAPATGTLQLTVAPLDPTTDELAAAPPLDRIDTDDDLLRSVFMADVTVWQGGVPLAVAPGRTIDLAFPVPPAAQAWFPAGSTVPAWWFDVEAGAWQEEGEGTIAADAAGVLWWRTSVSHLTSWNADQRGGDPGGAGGGGGVNSVRIRVVDPNGDVVAGAAITGESALTASSATTGYDGEACVRVPRGSTWTFRAGAQGAHSAPEVVEVPLSDAQCDEDGDVLTLVVERACIAGTVEDEDGTPIADAAVVGRFDQGTSSTTTDADGAYCLGVPPETEVDLFAVAELRSSDELSVTSGPPETCGGPDCTTAPVLVVRSACMEGRVVDEAGAPQGQRVVEASSGGRDTTALTARDGTYCVAVAPGASVEASTDFATPVSGTAPGVAHECGDAGCGTLPDLVVSNTCLAGFVLGVAGVDAPAVVAVVQGESGPAYYAGAVDPTDGTYCVGVPRGAEATVWATGTVLGSPIASLAEVVVAPDLTASCGSGACGTVPDLTLEALTCIDVQVEDEAGWPVDDASVRMTFVDPTGLVHDDVVFETLADGKACFAAPAESLVRLTLEDELGLGDGTSPVRPTELASAQLVTQSLQTLVCDAGVCDVVRLTQPTVGCIDATLLDASGAPLDRWYVEARWDGVPGPTSQSQFTDLGGEACFEVPQDTTVALSAAEFLDVGAATVVVPGGPDARCGSSACVPVTLQTLPRACIEGTVADGGGAPPYAAPLAFAEDLGGATGGGQADANGDWCLEVPTNAELTLSARAFDEYGNHLASTAVHVSTGATTGTCGSGTCQVGPQLVVDPAAQACLSGRAWLHREGALAVPPGTSVTVYDGGFSPSCDAGEDDPRTWGVVLGEATVGDDGRFCVPVPMSSTYAGRFVQLNVGGCGIVGGVASEIDPFSGPPTGVGLRPGECGGACEDLGALVLLR